MRIIISGGGTGGHVSPALAIADRLIDMEPGSEVLFICRSGGPENSPVEKSGYKVKYIDVQGLERKISVKNVKSIFLALQSLIKAKRIIKEFSPDAVIGTGGYVCWPVLHSAASLGIPTAIHESNLSPGLVTRILAKKCTKILINHNETRQYLKRKSDVIQVGNPIRANFSVKDYQSARRQLGIKQSEIYIVSFGGSGGARKINESVKGLKEYYKNTDAAIRHLHASGARYYEMMKNENCAESKIKFVPYIDDMPTHLIAADIAICRCGAMTLSELALSKTAAILIPSPNVTDDHQYKNARHFCDANAAILLRDEELNSTVLYERIEELVCNRKKREKLSKKIGSLADPDAACRIVGQLRDMIGRDESQNA